MKRNNFFLSAALALVMLVCLLPWVDAAQDVPFKTFSNQRYHYSIQYPAGWKCVDHGKGVVVFKGGTDKPFSHASVNIQTIFTRKAHGKYATVKDLMDDFYSQVPMHTEAAHFLERRPIVLDGPSGKLFGEETTFTFKDNGQTFKQRQVMMMSKDGNLFQAWAYRAPLLQYDDNSPAAATMLASWVID